jgi:hypothetical protein
MLQRCSYDSSDCRALTSPLISLYMCSASHPKMWRRIGGGQVRGGAFDFGGRGIGPVLCLNLAATGLLAASSMAIAECRSSRCSEKRIDAAMTLRIVIVKVVAVATTPFENSSTILCEEFAFPYKLPGFSHVLRRHEAMFLKWVSASGRPGSEAQ